MIIPVTQICQDVSNKNGFAQANEFGIRDSFVAEKADGLIGVYSYECTQLFLFLFQSLLTAKKRRAKQDEEVVPILRFNFIILIAHGIY